MINQTVNSEIDPDQSHSLHPTALNSQKQILIIDDEDDVIRPLSLRLNRLGYQVTVANDGQTGLRLAMETLPSLIVLDLFLPGFSGEEICKSIKDADDKRIQEIPIIMVTAKSGEADRIVGRVLGANAYFTKPYETEDLLVVIQQLIEAGR